MEKKLVCGVILARSGSKEIKNKNILKIKKKPILYYVAKQASMVEELDKIFILTDSDKYLKIIKNLAIKKVFGIGRSKKSSTDKAQSEIALNEFIKKYPYEHIVFIQATNIFLKQKDIKYALKIYFNDELDSLLSVVKSKKFFWKKYKKTMISVNYDYRKRKIRQDMDEFFLENGSFYIFSKKGFLKHKNRLHGKIGYYEMDQKSYFEIDDKDELEIVKRLI